jgi:exo-beta-1,3-glucanase (GH17 family)
MTTIRALRGAFSRSPGRCLAAVVLGVAGLVACGGGGEVPATQPGGLRELPADFATRKAVAYSPFRGADPNIAAQVVTRDNVLQDLGLLAQGGFTLIRTFDSSLPYVRLVLQAIRDNRINMKVQLGIKLYPLSTTGADLVRNLSLNTAEIAAGIALANEFKDVVIAVAVGNETITFGTVTLEQMSAYIATVRATVTQPITTGEYWDGYCGLRSAGPRSGQGLPAFITNQIDYASIHVYPILQADGAAFSEPWDSEQQTVPEARRAEAMMDAAFAFARSNFDCARKHLDGQGHARMPIVIGETGWQTVPTGNLTYLHHPVNQKLYYDRLLTWGDKAKYPNGPLNVYYFSAFDEPWKQFQVQGYNEDNWGLFNVQRQAKYAVQSLYPASQWDSGRFTPADATFAPTVVTPVITANRYRVFADVAVAGEAIAPAIQWFGFDSPPNAFAGEGNDSTLAAEGARFLEIGPAPSNVTGRDYGWGVLTVSTPARTDLSGFQAGGRLNFSIKTTYPGRLMFGFGTAQGGAVFVVASNTNADGYGYVNDGTWRQVSIPISAFTAPGNPFDLRRVTNALVVADIYDRTGNTARGDTTKVFIDGVFWSK